MAFNPQSITPSTLKSLVDNLASHLKANPLPKAPKRSQVQEALAAALGWPNWHGAITAAKARESRAPVAPSEPWKLPTEAFLGNPGRDASLLVHMAKSRLGDAQGIWRVPAADMARHALIRGSEAARRALLEQVVRLNPDRPILLIQGPGSLPLRRWDGQQARESDFAQALATAPAIDLVETVADALPTTGEPQWRARTVSLVSAVIFALVELRPTHGLGLQRLTEHLELANLQDLSAHKRLSPRAAQAVKAYLRSLPGYQDGQSAQPPTTQEHHGYLTMHVHRVLDRARQDRLRMSPVSEQASTARLRLDTMDDGCGPWVGSTVLQLMDQWPARNPGGLMVLDGLHLEDQSWEGLPLRLPRWQDMDVGVWLGVNIVDDMPVGALRDRILARLASDLRVFE